MGETTGLKDLGGSLPKSNPQELFMVMSQALDMVKTWSIIAQYNIWLLTLAVRGPTFQIGKGNMD